MPLEKLVLLPKSAVTIGEHLRQKGKKTPKDISKETGLAPRTVSLGLKKLMGPGYVGKVPNIQWDMRQPLYYLNAERWSEYLRRYGHIIN